MAVGGGVSEIEDDVRELVRRRGLDPLTDPAAVSRLVAEVIADYDERSLDRRCAAARRTPGARPAE